MISCVGLDQEQNFCTFLCFARVSVNIIRQADWPERGLSIYVYYLAATRIATKYDQHHTITLGINILCGRWVVSCTD